MYICISKKAIAYICTACMCVYIYIYGILKKDIHIYIYV